MSTTNLIRWGSVAFIVGGAVWIVLNLVTLAAGSASGTAPTSLVLYVLALLLSSLGLVGFHLLQRESYGRIGRGGFYTVLVSSALLVLSALGALTGGEPLGILNPVGLLGVVVGFALYGAATLQARVLPRWCGVLFIAFLPISVVLGAYGNIVTGLAQLGLGYVLLRQSGGSEQRSSRVR